MACSVHLCMIAVQMFVPNTMSGIISNKRKAQSESAEHFIATANEHLEGFDLLRSFHLTEASRVAMSSANQAWEKQNLELGTLVHWHAYFHFTVGQIILHWNLFHWRHSYP